MSEIRESLYILDKKHADRGQPVYPRTQRTCDSASTMKN